MENSRHKKLFYRRLKAETENLCVCESFLIFLERKREENAWHQINYIVGKRFYFLN